ncbi:MAG: hypothetical protein EAZ35_02555 [Sphingobacteriia bacterium]|nr:MAG: hypothetical protein EAZ35_02555 [Sphingobacteriia bacterium]
MKVLIQTAFLITTFLFNAVMLFAQGDLPPAAITDQDKYLQDKKYKDTLFSKEFGKTISLNGKWEIAEGGLNTQPTKYFNTISVPGIVNNKETNFKNIGSASNLREAFWYRKKFSIQGAVPAMARLKIFKAMYGSKVFLNGQEIGENPLNFTPGYFNITPFLKGNNELNELIVRVGAYISNVPDTVLSGGEAERQHYPPGIYDRVELILSGSAYLIRTQVVPDIERKLVRIIMETTSTQSGNNTMDLKLNLYDFGTGKNILSKNIVIHQIEKGKINSTEIILPIPDCKLWSPENPNLYILKLSDESYSYTTRFGMRTYKIDTAFTNRALLNGDPYYIRGTNFAIHRFFEDPLCIQQPWDRVWVRKLFTTYARMGMNGVRFCISAAPELWYDIADEVGMMVFDEFPLWSAFQPDFGDISDVQNHPYKKWGIVKTKVKAVHIANEFTHWMQERWNHPSVVVWDAQNETWSPEIGKAISMVRKLDFSDRPWDNGWSPPVSATDIREAHPYFEAYVKGTEQINDRKQNILPFTLADIPKHPKVPSTFYLPYQYAFKQLPLNWYWQQAVVINEYSYLWLNRNGQPTTLTKGFYDAALGADATADQRRELYAKYLAAVTEYWRSLRTCIGVIYPFGINYSIPTGETSDNLIDVDSISFDSFFLKYIPSAFAPVGISIDYWNTTIQLDNPNGTAVDIPLIITNDAKLLYRNKIQLKLMQGNHLISSIKTHYEVLPLQQTRVILRMNLPNNNGIYQLVAEMETGDGNLVSSYRDIELVNIVNKK